MEWGESRVLDNGLGMETLSDYALINKITNEGGCPTQDNNVLFAAWTGILVKNHVFSIIQLTAKLARLHNQGVSVNP